MLGFGMSALCLQPSELVTDAFSFGRCIPFFLGGSAAFCCFAFPPGKLTVILFHYPFADKAKTNLVEVRRVNTASTISQRDAYKLMLKDYPDVMSIEQMCEILSISTKTGYRILREGKICCLKVGRAYRIPKAHLFTFLCIGCGEAVTA